MSCPRLHGEVTPLWHARGPSWGRAELSSQLCGSASPIRMGTGGAVGIGLDPGGLPDLADNPPPHSPLQENRMMQHTVQALQSELDNLRADNIKLYEKIKFLQSYPGRVSGCPSVCPAGGFAQTDRPQARIVPCSAQEQGEGARYLRAPHVGKLGTTGARKDAEIHLEEQAPSPPAEPAVLNHSEGCQILMFPPQNSPCNACAAHCPQHGAPAGTLWMLLPDQAASS